ncbi:MAG: cation diffusion facilitator family transporter [Peptostreptococcaceae bacterium]
MFSNYLIKKFINNSENIEDKNIRGKYAYLTGLIGIICNLILFIIKISIGLLTSSISIMADGFNNLSDMVSSIITIVGFKLASLPPDKEHPFGHGRLEYVSALIVAFMVMLVGMQFTKSSIDRILNPVSVKFELIPFLILLISIFIKFWLSKFNKFVGEKINSSAIKASGVDALGDVYSSSTVVLAFLISNFTSIPIDGYVGVLVSILILFAGYNLVKETISPLLGEAPDEEFVKDLNEMILSYDLIIGSHDLIVHNYGAQKTIASVHVEIPADLDLLTVHNLIDKAEREISDKLNIHLVMHMDPVCIKCEVVKEARDEINKIIKYNPLIESMHDFRMIVSNEKKSLIFDVVVNSNKFDKVSSEEELKKYLNDCMKEIDENYECVVTIDRGYN